MKLNTKKNIKKIENLKQKNVAERIQRVVGDLNQFVDWRDEMKNECDRKRWIRDGDEKNDVTKLMCHGFQFNVTPCGPVRQTPKYWKHFLQFTPSPHFTWKTCCKITNDTNHTNLALAFTHILWKFCQNVFIWHHTFYERQYFSFISKINRFPAGFRSWTIGVQSVCVIPRLKNFHMWRSSRTSIRIIVSELGF